MPFDKKYINYLRSVAWQNKRQQAFAKYGKICAACGRRGTQVHHLSYQNLGREPLSDLMILCKDCHVQVTKLYRANRRRGLRRVTLEFVTYKRNGRSSR